MYNTERAATIMRRMGFPDSEKGTYVSLLRQHILNQVERGLHSRGAPFWGDEGRKFSYEEKARYILEIDWEIDNGHSCRVENIEGWNFSDALRRTGMKARIAWHRIIGRRNPYSNA